MKIAVVDLVSLDGGGYQVTKSLFQYATTGNGKLHQWLFIVSKQKFESTKSVKVVKFPEGSEGYGKRAITEITKVKKCLKEYGADVIVSMSNMGVIGCNLKQIIYLQQSIPFQKEKKFSFFKKEESRYAFRQYIQGWFIKKSIKNARAVLVQTNWVREEVQKVSRKTPVINIGYPAENKSREHKVRANNVSTDFFYPCGPAIYKNLSVVVKAVNCLIKKGMKFKFYVTLTREEMQELTSERVIAPDVFQYLGRISPEEVAKKYVESTLVFASYIETLGLPLVEAREAGTWIIASNCAFSHEVLDDYPNRDYFDPFDEVDLMRKMEAVLEGKKSLKQYEIRSLENCCWDKMVTAIQK